MDCTKDADGSYAINVPNSANGVTVNVKGTIKAQIGLYINGNNNDLQNTIVVDGVPLVVSQHSTRQPIHVEVKSGVTLLTGSNEKFAGTAIRTLHLRK